MNSGKRVDGVDGVDRFSVELSRFVRLDRFQGLLCSSSNSADKDRPHPYFSLPYIAVLVTKSVRSFYALKTIRTNGLNGNALWDVTRATLVSQLLYASHAWWGYFKADERNPLQSIIVKATVRVLLRRSFSTLDELRENSPILTINCSSQPGTIPTMFSTAFCPNLKLLNITYVNAYSQPHIAHGCHVNATMKQKFVHRMLPETFIDAAFMFYSHLYIFPQTM